MPKIQAPPEWGIEPILEEHRRLGFLDFFVLWGDLGIGLLVLFAGSFLVPGLSLGQALLAILIGSLIGCLLLALTGVVGSENGVPTMVLLRPVLGIRGSYLPTAINVLQLIGWTIFEIIIMGHAANAISRELLGWDNYLFWAVVFAAIVILMGVWGPIAVIRQWLEKFAVWVVLLTIAWLTSYLFTNYDIPALLKKPGTGDLPFWLAVDIVIAMPISWMPLVADYNRFARRPGRAFWGTYLGYLVTNIWFYALGALVLLAAGITQEPKGFVTAIVLIAGPLALLILLADETDEAWADLYSAAVSLQNVFPKLRQRWLILSIGLFCFLVAAVLDITQYENFLLLIGSVFVPLFGILAADYFVLRGRRYEVEELYRPGGRYWYSQGIRWRGMAAWIFGILIYHIIARELPSLGASLPSFVAAFLMHLLLGEAERRKVQFTADEA